MAGWPSNSESLPLRPIGDQALKLRSGQWRARKDNEEASQSLPFPFATHPLCYSWLFIAKVNQDCVGLSKHMMDPLSITVAITALVGVCKKVKDGLEEFYTGARFVNAKLQALRDEVANFVTVLELMETTLGDDKVKASVPQTGHIGSHWNNIKACIADGTLTLERLATVIERVDIDVGILDITRKYARMNSAADEISVYRQQVRTYRDTMHLSIQTVIL